MKLYFASVGRGASLLLNLPPDRRGQIPEEDAQSLTEFHRRLQGLCKTDLAPLVEIQASKVRGHARQFGAANLVDGRRDTCWTTDDAIKTPEPILDLARPLRSTSFGCANICRWDSGSKLWLWIAGRIMVGWSLPRQQASATVAWCVSTASPPPSCVCASLKPPLARRLVNLVWFWNSPGHKPSGPF